MAKMMISGVLTIYKGLFVSQFSKHITNIVTIVPRGNYTKETSNSLNL